METLISPTEILKTIQSAPGLHTLRYVHTCRVLGSSVHPHSVFKWQSLVGMTKSAFLFACHDRELRALSTGHKQKKAISTQLCHTHPSTSSDPSRDRRALIRPRNLLRLRQQQRTRVHRKEGPQLLRAPQMCLLIWDLTQLHLKSTFLSTNHR